jgi:hypothetical protein
MKYQAKQYLNLTKYCNFLKGIFYVIGSCLSITIIHKQMTTLYGSIINIMVLKIFIRNIVLVLTLGLATIMAADSDDGTETVSIRGTLSVSLAATLAITDTAVTGPPIALYAMGCAVVDSVKSLYNRVCCLGYRGEERILLRQRANRQFLQTCFYASSGLLIMNDALSRICTGNSSNIGTVALGLAGAADS